MKYNIFLLALLLISCSKKTTELPIEPNPINNELEVIWQKALTDNTGSCWSITPNIYNNQVIFSESCKSYPTILSFDKSTGDSLWIWDNAISSGEIASIAGSFQLGNYLAFCTGKKVYSINMDTHIADVRSAFDYGRKRINGSGGKLYYSKHTNGLDWDKSWLMQTNLNTENWISLFEINNSSGYRPGLEPPVLWLDSMGDSVLIFQNRSWNFSAGKGKIDIYAVNQNDGSIEWVHDSVAPEGNSSVHLPLVVNDKIYFQGQGSISCLDATDGALLWQRYFPNLTEDFLACNIVYAEDKIIAKSTNDNIYAFNTETGSTIWKRSGTSANCTNMAYYDGKVFYAGLGSHVIQAVDISNGRIVWTEASPNKKNGYPSAAFAGGITIDQETGYLYTNDRYFAMCIKIPDDL